METLTNFKTEFSTIEILGAESLFNIAFENEYGFNPSESFFVSCETINSESDANGTPLQLDGFDLSHLSILKSGMLAAVCYDDNENEIAFRIEENNITRL